MPESGLVGYKDRLRSDDCLLPVHHLYFLILYFFVIEIPAVGRVAKNDDLEVLGLYFDLGRDSRASNSVSGDRNVLRVFLSEQGFSLLVNQLELGIVLEVYSVVEGVVWVLSHSCF